MTFVSMRIAGIDVSASTRETFERRGPVTGRIVSSAPAASVADAQAAARAADEALPGWSALGPNARRGFLSKAADALAAKGDLFVEAMSQEIGATEPWARFNVHIASSMLREAASLTTQVAGEVIPSDKPGCLSMAVREPAGVCLGIAPWNAPVILGVRAIATPLACGNTVVFKASEICPRTHALIVEALDEAGIPDGVVNLLTNDPKDAGDIVGALIDHPAVRRINFTGSTKVGRIIAERAARNLKPCLLELGGKAPLLVLRDADIEEAVNASIFGAFFNQGQICMSTERIILAPEIADDFTTRFVERARGLTAGDPGENAAPLGAVVDLSTAEKVSDLIEDARSKGAIIHSAGPAEGVLMPAQVVERATPDMRIYAEESFGPVVALIRASDEDEMLRMANDTEYGLSAAVFTRDIARGLTIARQIRSGICHVNGPTVHDEAQMPFGGTKASGYGRFGGRAGIAEFTELRWITVESQPGKYPL